MTQDGPSRPLAGTGLECLVYLDRRLHLSVMGLEIIKIQQWLDKVALKVHRKLTCVDQNDTLGFVSPLQEHTLIRYPSQTLLSTFFRVL